jgi:nucleoside phosphorylase
VSHPRPNRLVSESDRKRFEPSISGLPDLAVIDWTGAGQAPVLLDTPSKPAQAAVLVITWAGAEWAAMEHVFCSSTTPMRYSDRDPEPFAGWERYETSTFWGYFRLVGLNGKTVLLFKSNIHLAEQGHAVLETLVRQLIAEVKPGLVLSIGTAGGANDTDHVGTVKIVSAATLYEKDAANWTTYSNGWQAPTATLSQASFTNLLMPIPVTDQDLDKLCTEFSNFSGTEYSLAELDPLGLNHATTPPVVVDQSGGATSLLTASTFLVGTTDNRYAEYSCVEMDDAIVAMVCEQEGTPFGSVRNVSDPAQPADLSSDAQSDWGGAVYDVYGLYTSFNGALAAWAVI